MLSIRVTGTFVKRGDNWVGMWRLGTLQPDGTTKREQRSQTFVGLSEPAARGSFQPILDALNAANHATLGLYAHVVPQSQRDAVEGLASALGSANC